MAADPNAGQSQAGSDVSKFLQSLNLREGEISTLNPNMAPSTVQWAATHPQQMQNIWGNKVGGRVDESFAQWLGHQLGNIQVPTSAGALTDPSKLTPVHDLVPKVGGGGGGGGGGGKQQAATDPGTLTGDAAIAQWLIGQIPNMKQGQLNTPSQTQQQALISAINNLDPKDAQRVMAALPQGATITKDVMKAEQPGGPTTSNDVLTMGMNLFMNQYLQPMMQKMNAANMGAVQQYGNAMNQAIAGPLPPGVAQFAKAMLPQQEGNMAMLNQANAAQAAGAPMFNAFMGGIGGEAQNLQSLIDIYTKLSSAADVQQLYGTSGLPGVLGAAPTAGTGGTAGTTGTTGTTPGGVAGSAGIPAVNLSPAQVLQSFFASQGG